METDWTVACGADDPWVVVPWSGSDACLYYIDLRTEPGRLNEIPEAAQYPSIAAALERWNQPESHLFTAKCDVWSYPARLFDAFDLPGFAEAHSSYIDLLARDTTVFSSFAACESLLRAWSANAQLTPHTGTRCEWTLRRARVFPLSAQAAESTAPPADGVAGPLYVWGYGSSPEAAASAWSEALTALIEPVLIAADNFRHERFTG